MKPTRCVRLDWRLANSIPSPVPVRQYFVSGQDKILEFATIAEAERFQTAAKLMWTTVTDVWRARR
jgi:hypothetical protein